MFDINGKVALITGGASGLGLSFAKELLRHGLKAVALADIHEELGHGAVDAINREFGINKAMYLKTDVSNKCQYEEAFKATIAAFTNLDILINNAGICNDRTWEREISVNLVGTINGLLLGLDDYIPKYKSGKEGIIVNISSVTAFRAEESFPIYASTKHAIIGLACAYGHEAHYNRTNVKLITLCPGYTNTAMTSGFLPDLTLGVGYTSMMKGKGKRTPQSPEFVATAMAHIIKEGKHGSIWVAENEQPPYEVQPAKL